MGFAPFIGNSAGKMANAANKNEKRKQLLIDQGTQAINSIYGGGTVPSYMAASGTYDPNKQYYKYDLNNGYSVFTPPANNIIAGPMGATYDQGPRMDQMIKNGKLFTAGPSKTYAGFSPQFFKDRAGAYERYALPQLGKQFGDANRAIDYGLADRGLMGSSVANKAHSDLIRENASQVQNVADVGRGQAQELQTNVENSRQSALAQLYATSDPQGASASALNSAASFQVPSAFAPVGQAFADLASQYAINNQLSQYNQPQYYSSQQGLSTPVNAGALPKY